MLAKLCVIHPPPEVLDLTDSAPRSCKCVTQYIAGLREAHSRGQLQMLNNQGHERGHDQGNTRSFGNQFGAPQNQGAFPLGGALLSDSSNVCTCSCQTPLNP